MADNREVVIIDFRMPFLSIVVLMVKWAIAAIPALIILWLVVMVGTMLFWGLMGGMMGGPWGRWGMHG